VGKVTTEETAVTTATFVLVPPQFHAAVEATPTERSLWLAIADYLAEEGAEVAAEALRWAVATGFEMYSHRNGSRVYWQSSELWRSLRGEQSSVVDGETHHNCHYRGGVHALNRLLYRWQMLTESERRLLWAVDNATDARAD
jgi:uncharacterized protein (TIGR02996 family)